MRAHKDRSRRHACGRQRAHGFTDEDKIRNGESLWLYIIGLREQGIDDWRKLEHRVHETFYLTEEEKQDLKELIRFSEPKRLRQFYLKMTVNVLREHGDSYREIGKLLGISKAKAHRLHKDWSRPQRWTIKELARWYEVSPGTIRNTLKKCKEEERKTNQLSQSYKSNNTYTTTN